MLAVLGYEIKYSFICLMLAGICDLFDGTVARRCKRTEEEKAFGVELDSLVDMITFVALPITLLTRINESLYFAPLLILYAIFAIARLAEFNISSPTNNKPVSYYEGLPVTYAALILSVVYLLSIVLDTFIFTIIFNICFFITALLFVMRIKVPKPGLKLSLFFLLLAIVVIPIYVVVI
jgi:CDP-diacylglycerol--serine O-phosphatidyltransferase